VNEASPSQCPPCLRGEKVRTLPPDTPREDLPYVEGIGDNWRQPGCAVCGRLGPWILDDGPDSGPGTDLVREPMLAAGFSEEIDGRYDEDGDQLIECTRRWVCRGCHGDGTVLTTEVTERTENAEPGARPTRRAVRKGSSVSSVSPW